MSDTISASAPEATAGCGNPDGSFIWYELMTPDPDAAARFYGAVVGWKIGDAPAQGQDYRMIARDDGGNAGGVLKLTPEMLAGGARPVWLGYLSVDDVDRAVAAIEADGGKLQMPATDIAVGRIAMIADPQGAPIYLMKPKPPAGQEGMASDVFAPLDAQHVRWNELASSDPDASIAFYRKHFGWSQEGEMDMGELGIYRFVQYRGVGIGAIMPTMPGMPHSIWSFYFGVPDIDAARQAIEAGGGSVSQDPMEIPGGEFALNASDPQGAPFGLAGPRKA